MVALAMDRAEMEVKLRNLPALLYVSCAWKVLLIDVTHNKSQPFLIHFHAEGCGGRLTLEKTKMVDEPTRYWVLGLRALNALTMSQQGLSSISLTLVMLVTGGELDAEVAFT